MLAWNQLTAVPALVVDALGFAIQANDIERALGHLDSWEPFAATYGAREWRIVQALCSLARSAQSVRFPLQPGPNTNRQADSSASTLHIEPIAIKRGESFLAPSVIHDILARWTMHPRVLENSIQSSVLLVLQEGVTARLDLEQLSAFDQPALFPDPRMMLFTSWDDQFQQALEDAVTYLANTGLLGVVRSDFRWRIVYPDGTAPRKLEGKSLGALFAVGLAALLTR